MKNKLATLSLISGALGAMFGTLAGSSQVWINVLVGGAMALLIFYLFVGYFKA
jgi:amino acid transporter